jgi:hypothetical protein
LCQYCGSAPIGPWAAEYGYNLHFFSRMYKKRFEALFFMYFRV